MRALVDTHTFFWWVLDDPKLSRRAHAFIADESNEILVSPVIAWELATKVRSGKWPEASDLAANLAGYIERSGFAAFPITIEHARVAGSFTARHRDPFDRMLAAQSQVEGIPLLSADPMFHSFGIAAMW